MLSQGERSNKKTKGNRSLDKKDRQKMNGGDHSVQAAAGAGGPHSGEYLRPKVLDF